MRFPDNEPGSTGSRHGHVALAWAGAVGVAIGSAAVGAAAAWGIGVGGIAAAGSVLALVLGGALALQLRREARHRAETRARDLAHLHGLTRRAMQLDEAEHLASVGSFDWSPATGALHWSEEHFRQWGLEPGAVEPSLEVFVAGLHPDDAARVQEQLQKALRGESRYDCMHRVRWPDGQVRHVHGRGVVTFDAQGQPLRMIGAVLDITERVQTESALRLQGFVLDALGDPVSVVDADQLRYRLVNRSWLETNRRTREQTVGTSLNDVFPAPVGSQRRQALTDCLTLDRTTVVRGPSPSPGLQGRITETRYFPFHDPQVSWRGAVMVSRDVTEDEAMRQRLSRNASDLSLTLNAVGDAIFATDADSPDSPVLFANDQLLQMWRIGADAARPLTARTIIDHARAYFPDPEAAVARIGAIIGGQGDADDRLELTDGRVIQRRCRRRKLEEREVRVWAFRDVTAEARALRSLAAAEARQRTLLSAFPGYIWVIDSEHRVAYLNPQAAAVYKPLVPPPLMPARELFGARVFERLRPAMDRALAGEDLSLDWYRPSRSGRTPEHLLIRMSPGTTPEGDRLCYAFGIDITSLKQAQAELISARDEAERANRAKTQFLSSMSHELRTPLNAVIGFSQVLALNAEGNLTPRQLRQMGDIRRAGQHLLTLINDLLDLARIEAGRTQLTLAPVALDDLAEECVQLVRPTASDTLQVRRLPSPADALVQSDRTRLKQVLINLLSNGVKYNRDGHHVELGWLRLADGRWRIEVRDDGPGLDADARSRLFQPFERLEAEHSQVVGTGIGLALSRSLVQLMGGEIGVDSEPGQGSCFWLVLQPGAAASDGDTPPVAAAAPAPAPVPGPVSVTVRDPASDAGPPAGPARVLYVDDNPINLALMEGLFEDLPAWQLTTCEHASQALEQIRRQPHDLLLVDLQMPGLDGFGLFQQVRADPALRQLPMIAVSADVSPETAVRCRQVGFADFVPKPVDAGRLMDAAQRALARTAEPPGLSS